MAGRSLGGHYVLATRIPVTRGALQRTDGRVTGVTPDLHLKTLFVIDGDGRIRSTREPNPAPGPIFTLIRGWSNCAWAVAVEVRADLAAELGPLAAEEAPLGDFQGLPVHAEKYYSLVGGAIASGPAFFFPDAIACRGDVQIVDDVNLLHRNFPGWASGELRERSPILAVFHEGCPVSICFCARLSETAVEAGVETARAFRGRGFAPRVTAAWAAAIRASGRTPLYSTSWNNQGSLAVARKLGLTQYANDWSLLGS